MKALLAILAGLAAVTALGYLFLSSTHVERRPVWEVGVARVEKELDDHLAWLAQESIAPQDPEKPAWIQDSRPDLTDQIVGYSRQLEPTQERARTEAEESAMAQLVALAALRWQSCVPSICDGVGFDAFRPAFTERLRKRFPSLVKERYDQKFDLHREPVYRSAVLVRARPEELERDLLAVLNEDANRRFAAQRKLLWAAGGIVGAGIAVFLGYSTLNAATRGHFAGTLRLISAIAFGVIILLLTLA